METDTFLEGVRGDLQAVTAGDEAGGAVAGRILRMLESSLRLRLMDTLGQAAQELSGQLPSGHVEVRLSGRDVQLVFVGPAEAAAAAEAAEATDDEGGTARLTLRMPDSLKVRVEQASGQEGISTNAWLVRAVQRALGRGAGARRIGNRITGYAQS